MRGCSLVLLSRQTFLTELGVFIKRIILFHSLLVNRNPVAGIYFHTIQSLELDSPTFCVALVPAGLAPSHETRQIKTFSPCSSSAGVTSSAWLISTN